MASAPNAVSFMESHLSLDDFLTQLAPSHQGGSGDEPHEEPDPGVHSGHASEEQRQEFLRTISNLNDQWKSLSTQEMGSLSDFIENAAQNLNFFSTPSRADIGQTLDTLSALVGEDDGRSQEDGMQRFLRTLGSLNERSQSLFMGDESIDEFIRRYQGDEMRRSSGMQHNNGAAWQQGTSRSPPGVGPGEDKYALLRTISNMHNIPGVPKEIFPNGGVPHRPPPGMPPVPGLPPDGIPRTKSQKARVARQNRRWRRDQDKKREKGPETKQETDTAPPPEEPQQPVNRLKRQASGKAQERWRAQMGFREQDQSGYEPSFVAASSSNAQPYPLPASAPSPSTGDEQTEEGPDRKSKRWKCLLRNRESAARDRARKKQYLKDLENRVDALTKENMALKARVEELERAAAGNSSHVQHGQQQFSYNFHPGSAPVNGTMMTRSHSGRAIYHGTKRGQR